MLLCRPKKKVQTVNVHYDLFSVFEKKRAICFYVFVLCFFIFHMFVNDIWLETVDINKTTILINHKVLLCQWHHIYTTTNNSFTTTVCSVTVSHSHMTPVQYWQWAVCSKTNLLLLL